MGDLIPLSEEEGLNLRRALEQSYASGTPLRADPATGALLHEAAPPQGAPNPALVNEISKFRRHYGEELRWD